MNSTASRLFGWLLGSALLIPVAVFTAAAAESPEPAPAVTPLPNVFNTELPWLVLPDSLRLTLRPHFGDLATHDYFRLTLGARYGLTPQWEFSGEMDTYVSHGFGDVNFGEKMGVAEVRLGVKYRFSDFLMPYWQTAVGLNYSLPVGNPPAELSDGLYHLTPYMTLAHKWKTRPNVTSFVSYGVNFLVPGNAGDTLTGDGVAARTWFVTPGVLWRRGAFDYSVETVFMSSAGLDSSGTYLVLVRPGLKWTLPARYAFYSRSRWVIGVSVHAGYGNGGEDIGTNVQLQTDFDFKRLWRAIPHPRFDGPK